MKSKALEEFVQKINMKLRIKDAVKELGFKPINDVLYSKNDCCDISLKFDENEICMWCNENPRYKLYKTYNLIRMEVSKEYCDEKGFIQKMLNKLEMGDM